MGHFEKLLQLDCDPCPSHSLPSKTLRYPNPMTGWEYENGIKASLHTVLVTLETKYIQCHERVFDKWYPWYFLWDGTKNVLTRFDIYLVTTPQILGHYVIQNCIYNPWQKEVAIYKYSVLEKSCSYMPMAWTFIMKLFGCDFNLYTLTKRHLVKLFKVWNLSLLPWRLWFIVSDIRIITTSIYEGIYYSVCFQCSANTRVGPFELSLSGSGDTHVRVCKPAPLSCKLTRTDCNFQNDIFSIYLVVSYWGLTTFHMVCM